MPLSVRSHQKELLDQPGIPFADIERNMRELDIINTWLGGHAISIAGLKYWTGQRKRVSICEIGCGGGDNLRALGRWCDKRGIALQVMGIDSNPHCITVAKQHWQGVNAEWIHSDYRDVDFKGAKPDILFSSLFCHHFCEEDLVGQLRWMSANAGLGWFINDLHRHFLAYHAIRQLTRWLSRSYLVKNDAPLSVLRGFTRSEWEALLQQAGTPDHAIHWKWAFRWLIVGSPFN